MRCRVVHRPLHKRRTQPAVTVGDEQVQVWGQFARGLRVCRHTTMPMASSLVSVRMAAVTVAQTITVLLRNGPF